MSGFKGFRVKENNMGSVSFYERLLSFCLT
jgi:hypothetical protein